MRLRPKLFPILITIALLAHGCNETHRARYSSWDELTRSAPGATVPENRPSDATDIDYYYDMDTNECFLLCRASEASLREIQQSLEDVAMEGPGVLPKRTRADLVDFWPDPLTREGFPASTQSPTHIYPCGNKRPGGCEEFLWIDPAGGRFAYWRSSC